MTNSEYQLYTLIVTFLSSIGTLLAVIVSLYLANRNRKISLKIDNDIFIFNDKSEYIFIQIVNNGYIPVYIKNILLEHNFFCKKYIPINEKYIDKSKTSFNPPVHKLEVGDMITLAISIEFISDIYKDILSDYSKLNLLFLKFSVTTSFNKTFKVKLNKNILSEIRK